ncbi:unnamed protein product [Albugo candida]|uniref:Uncharacterized protein n=1 Tax=Albugo candida TaxID=65357 RepID=A0A024G9H9_9STRA|nr:unnamed protein product [Albugo candida]|eukprot:CCI43378.1 unnamed protein product [Albugo candida]
MPIFTTLVIQNDLALHRSGGMHTIDRTSCIYQVLILLYKLSFDMSSFVGLQPPFSCVETKSLNFFNPTTRCQRGIFFMSKTILFFELERRFSHHTDCPHCSTKAIQTETTMYSVSY